MVEHDGLELCLLKCLRSPTIDAPKNTITSGTIRCFLYRNSTLNCAFSFKGLRVLIIYTQITDIEVGEVGIGQFL